MVISIGVAECLPGTFAQLGDYYNNCTCRVYIKEGIEIEDTTCKMLTLQEQRERGKCGNPFLVETEMKLAFSKCVVTRQPLHEKPQSPVFDNNSNRGLGLSLEHVLPLTHLTLLNRFFTDVGLFDTHILQCIIFVLRNT